MDDVQELWLMRKASKPWHQGLWSRTWSQCLSDLGPHTPSVWPDYGWPGSAIRLPRCPPLVEPFLRSACWRPECRACEKPCVVPVACQLAGKGHRFGRIWPEICFLITYPLGSKVGRKVAIAISGSCLGSCLPLNWYIISSARWKCRTPSWKIIRNFKTETTEHEALCEVLLSTEPVWLHRTHPHEASCAPTIWPLLSGQLA